MLFENDRLSLETILGAIQHFNWEQAWYLSTQIASFLHYMDIHILPDLDFDDLTAKVDSVVLSLPKGEKLTYDRVEVAVALLNKDELLTLREALREVMRHRKPTIMLPKMQKVGNAPISPGYAISFSQSLLYPERDPATFRVPAPEAERQAHELISQARQEKQNGNMEKCSELADQAVRVMEQSGLPPFEIRISRERLLLPNNKFYDSTKMLPILEEALTYYRQQGDVNLLLHTLAQMARMLEDKDKEKALKLVDEAIQLAEQNNLPIFAWKRQRHDITKFSQPYDSRRAEETAITQEELAYYKQQNNLEETLHVLMNLSALESQSGNKMQALQYLDEAHILLANITEDEIEALSHTYNNRSSAYEIKARLQWKFSEIEHRRKHLTSSDTP